MTAIEFYLATPILQDGEAFLPVLAQGLARQCPAAVLLRLADAPEAQLIKIIKTVQPLVQGQDIALMLQDRPALAQKTGCDGVHLSAAFTGGSVRDIRKALGDDLQLGITVGTSRDAAMRAGESGADYVLFSASTGPRQEDDNLTDAEPESLAALVQWWCMMMELPAVADVPEAAELAQFAQTGVDFILPGSSFWDKPEAWQVPA
ncbi:thiamine phosphate synthase [Acetobacter cibinongensis]|uniref:Thiamine phosphate pyrophosphorylase n=1 Tax=Acetobacter cibinongensis TaxID=146475 RepID=A0A1Z5YZA4_9PROT|nr:thiamine phosphate synthase [Acetobacter cibinongensis]OUJ04671.1 thiamine phosphate pyrophosphorylase [Acetobacter cibinongensis]GAN59662.1 thiamine phosphate pyrophosphorylase [Acetobacter cibinongensis]GBQ15282.1 thiamine phosphate pyrophosphorylase [Acetobacter cibinongensis NRIC 0482]GEL59185.1 thiamine-phosphate synthase [Acetobacter cibinongensis]